MPICKKCSTPLISRGKSPSGLLLFYCPACDEKWQGHNLLGYLHIYQVRGKSGRILKDRITTVRYTETEDAIIEQVGGQSIFDKGIEAYRKGK